MLFGPAVTLPLAGATANTPQKDRSAMAIFFLIAPLFFVGACAFAIFFQPRVGRWSDVLPFMARVALPTLGLGITLWLIEGEGFRNGNGSD
jgi:hypothetical protein